MLFVVSCFLLINTREDVLITFIVFSGSFSFGFFFGMFVLFDVCYLSRSNSPKSRNSPPPQRKEKYTERTLSKTMTKKCSWCNCADK